MGGPFNPDLDYFVPTDDEDRLFIEYRDSLDPKHWSRYDLAAVRQGWDAGRAALRTGVDPAPHPAPAEETPSPWSGGPIPTLRDFMSRMAVLGGFRFGDRVTKKSGSSWTGPIVGFYSTKLTPVGYAVESENEPGSVQIYPEAAIRKAPE